MLHGEVSGYQGCLVLLEASKASASSTGLTVMGPVTSAGTNGYFEQENGNNTGEQRGYRDYEEIVSRTILNV